MAEDNFEKMMEVVDGHIQQRGFGAVKLKDGEMFFFTADALEKLLIRAKENPDGRVAVFVPVQQ
jgi:hypothetical protein